MVQCARNGSYDTTLIQQKDLCSRKKLFAFVKEDACISGKIIFVRNIFRMDKGATTMSRDGNRANTPAGAQISGLLLLSIGLYGIVLGEAFQLLLELGLWPGALTNDAFMAPLFLSLGLIFVASILVLAGLCCLKVHWLVALGTFLLALLVAYVQGQLFPTNPASYSLYWFLTYGGILVILSFFSLAPLKGVWPLLWRMLLVNRGGAG